MTLTGAARRRARAPRGTAPAAARQEVAKFFSDFGSTIGVDEFTPLTFAGTDNEVLTVVRFRGRSRATGKGVSMNLHHYFRFRDGKVEYYRGTEDTAQMEAALTS